MCMDFSFGFIRFIDIDDFVWSGESRGSLVLDCVEER